MIDMLMQYGLFLAKATTLLAMAWVLFSMIASLAHRRARVPERLEIRELNKRYEEMSFILRRALLAKRAFKKLSKETKARDKKQQKARQAGTAPHEKRVFVINFRGDIKATAVSSLREEITAVLTVATPDDEVVLRLENSGGLVSDHGLAASQLERIRRKNIPLTVAVDKVAASGGYMMACVANRIISAPFAAIGSIGVIVQLPNFHRLLDSQGIDFEQVKAGEFKRTVSMFARNTDEERAKLREQLEDLHRLFKELVHLYRPGLELSRVATGEHWYGSRALELKLVDALMTSDDYLLEASRSAKLYEVSYTAKKPVSEKVAAMVDATVHRLFYSLWQQTHEARLPQS